MLNRFLNEHLQGKSVTEVRRTLAERIKAAESEIKEFQALANRLLDELGGMMEPEALYLDGAGSLIEGAEDIGDLSQMQSVMRVMEDRRRLADFAQCGAGRRKSGKQAGDGRDSNVSRVHAGY